MEHRPRRSVLFIPSINDRAIEKAKTLPADGLIFDLEDSVSPDQKETARHNACQAVTSRGYGNRDVIVRINGYDSLWGKNDLQDIVAVKPDAILVPKVETPDDVLEIIADMDTFGASESLKLWIMMETPLAVLYARDIASLAKTHGRLSCLVMGLNDLAKETGAQVTEDRFAMVSWISTCVAAARAYKINILDSVYNDFSNQSGFENECLQSRQLGMDGKTLIHPSQIDIANRIFAPSEEELSWAKKVLEHFDMPQNQDKGVVQIEGQMVERLHAEMARTVVEKVKLINASKNQEG